MIFDDNSLSTGRTPLARPNRGPAGRPRPSGARPRGRRLPLTMPDTMSVERRKVLAALGVHLVLTAGALGMKAAIAKAEEIRDQAPERIVLLDQFNNPANPDIHSIAPGSGVW